MAAHQNKQLGFAPACLQRGCQRDRVSGVSAIGEQCHGAEHLAGRDEAHDDLRAIASGLGDADAALDQDMGTPRIALVEDPGLPSSLSDLTVCTRHRLSLWN